MTAMTLQASVEQDQLRSMVRDFCAAHSREQDVRAAMASPAGFDLDVWTRFGDLGLTGLAVPEQYGGSGGSWADVSVVAEETGRALLCAPWLSHSVLATAAVLAAGDADAQRDLLPVLAAGERRMTVASAETARTWLPPQPEVAAEQTGGAWVVTGTKRSVLDGADAHELLVLAATPSGPALFLVAADDARVSRSANPTMDRTRRLAEVQFDAAPGRLVGELGAGVDALRRAGQIASTMLACEQVGAAATVLDLMVEYAGVREQFGRPIGTFQAIKHSCAETMLQVESATSAARHAVHTINDSPAELAHWSSVALVYCSEAFSAATYRAVQLFGGIGFTWEHPIHLYLKRAAGARQLFGNPGQHRELLASELGLTTSEDATS